MMMPTNYRIQLSDIVDNTYLVIVLSTSLILLILLCWTNLTKSLKVIIGLILIVVTVKTNHTYCYDEMSVVHRDS